jgi:hypothetical protein
MIMMLTTHYIFIIQATNIFSIEILLIFLQKQAFDIIG